MKSLIAAISLVAVSLALASPSFAADKKEGEKKAAPKQFTGVVDSCDAACIKVKKGDDCKAFVVNDKTKVATADKKEAAIADIKAGDKVLVSYAEDGDKLVAKRICPPAAAGKKKEEKK
jgi:Cu/Ag efflux protein CusF